MDLRALLTDPARFEEHRLLPRSDHTVLFYGEETARTLLLDGTWRFHYASDLPQRVEGFEALPALWQQWGGIAVPGHINLQGFGAPQYTNTAYPWDGREDIRPPELPARIPVGQYLHRFTLPQGWQGQALRLRFEGVEPAFRVWCNGGYVGYSEDSFTPAEFDVTGLLRPGENLLAVEVYRWASGSWLEDQDFWRFWGIFRSVKLLCLPGAFIEDVTVAAAMEGELTIKVRLTGAAASVQGLLIAPDGSEAARLESRAQNGEALLTARVVQPLLWSAETPWLYNLRLTLWDEPGQPLSEARLAVGFRTLRIKQGIMTINGQRLVFHGVNRHEFSAATGRAIGMDEMQTDARFMKQSNINAVRTSHYPNRTEWYELCDALGLYMIDETNLETHGTWCDMRRGTRRFSPLPGDDPQWKQAVFARAQAMFQRDKNHPAVVLWSCGNESGHGDTLWQMSELFRQWDPTRPVHYESVSWSGLRLETTDLRSTMYLPPREVEASLKAHPEKPYIQCEYAHAMGNSCGALDEYVALEEKYPHYQGGFVWDWVDQQLLAHGRLCYGDDFDDRPTDGDFCANGLLFADHTHTPKLAAVKAAYQPCKLTITDEWIQLQNKLLFTNVSTYLLVLRLLADGEEVHRQTLAAACAPGQTVRLPWQPPQGPAGCELVAEASLCLAQKTPWAPAGHTLALAQTVLRTKAAAQSGWRLVDGGENVGLVGQRLTALFSKKSGRLVSLRTPKGEWVQTPFAPTFWRAPVSNDTASRYPQEKAQWKNASLYQTLERFCLQETGPVYVVETVFRLPTIPAGRCTLRYSFEPGDVLRVSVEGERPDGLPAPFCFGLEGSTRAEHQAVRYYGYGPGETAADRLSGGALGLWELNAQKALTPYMKPQACGLRSETRWLECGGLRITGGQPLQFSALPFTCHELENAGHPWQLPPVDKTVLRLLAWECGVGGDDTWGARPHPQYQMEQAPLHLEFTIACIGEAKEGFCAPER